VSSLGDLQELDTTESKVKEFKDVYYCARLWTRTVATVPPAGAPSDGVLWYTHKQWALGSASFAS